eukprot:TRINITY_DN10780_c0_g1_i2.p1 TRINITY_DN10780_c0_g1~~TRINITY_DN10780_c0_g1_i2.p1  ORF type:complete len:229 (+),score=35.06 TRINITY_DN10780_c0_g1_i2:24-710(+)
MAAVEEQGLGVVFAVADDENTCKPFAGLALLSQVCVEEQIPGTHLINSANAVPACKRVGLRKPRNEEREKITLLKEPEKESCRSAYLYYSSEYGAKPNSVLTRQLPDRIGDYSLTEIDCTGNFIGDKGLLALLEVVKLCTACSKLLLPDNGIRNAGVECIVHTTLEHPSLSVIDLSNNRITLGAGKVLQELASKNQTIKEINVSGTRIDPQLQDRIQARVKGNIERNM